MPTVDERVEDLIAVMDAAGVERAHVLGLSEGGPVAIALAATYPERVETLALFGSGARTVGDETDEQREARRAGVRYFHQRWGTEESVTLDVFGPSVGRRRRLPGLGAPLRAAVGDPGRARRAARR